MRSRDCAVSMSGNSTKDGTRCSGGEHRFTYPATRRTVKPFAHYIGESLNGNENPIMSAVSNGRRHGSWRPADAT